MIDIAFNNSAAGVIQFSRYNGALQTEGVLPLLFTLSYGTLSGDMCEAEAKKETIAFRNFIPDLDEKEYIKAYKEDVDERRKSLQKLDRYLKQGKDIRLWISATADDRCGLYWLCDRMKNTKSRLYVVPCPGYEWNAEKKLIHSTDDGEEFFLLRAAEECESLDALETGNNIKITVACLAYESVEFSERNVLNWSKSLSGHTDVSQTTLEHIHDLVAQYAGR